MPFTVPSSAAWRHEDARVGFEVACFSVRGSELHIAGSTSAVENGVAWIVDYHLVLDDRWRSRRAELTGRTAAAERHTVVEHDGDGSWLVDGGPAPQLDGCRDVDLESSALTNAFPVHREAMHVGVDFEAPAAYVRAPDLGVDRLEQTYRRVGERRYDYYAPVFELRCVLEYDEDGLLRTYPGIAARVQ